MPTTYCARLDRYFGLWLWCSLYIKKIPIIKLQTVALHGDAFGAANQSGNYGLKGRTVKEDGIEK
jgi:hypothetical protein